MSEKHLKIDNLKPLSNGNKRKVKKVKCYEVYIFYDNNGEIIEEEVIRELTPKVVKKKHFNQKWNSTSQNSLSPSKKAKNKSTNSTRTKKINLMRTLLSKNRTITRITPFSLLRNSDVRRSPIKHTFYGSSNQTHIGNFYSSKKKKEYSRKNDPVKIIHNYKRSDIFKHGYSKYPKRYIKKQLFELDSNENLKEEKKKYSKGLFEFELLSAVPYNGVKKQLSITPSITFNQKTSKINILSQENCIKIRTFAKGFNITDVQNWVHNNCFLVKMYIPNVTCSEIDALIDSCYNKKML
uniref:PRE_C2HC domain-containing protein n=1 Tax=Strongyloides venezuelensis TaxID=75913 RepID=A0A0K0F2K2_STRVS